jgi:hypothetical protein
MQRSENVALCLPSSRSIFGARDERRTGVPAARTVSKGNALIETS